MSAEAEYIQKERENIEKTLQLLKDLTTREELS